MYKKEDNRFIRQDEITSIMQVQYKDKWYDTYIDTILLEKISQFHWRTSHKKNKVYIVTGSAAGKQKLMYLHNFLMDYTPQDGFEIDHIDCNSLNNRLSNLRLVPRQVNIENTSVRIDNKIGIRGISQSSSNNWRYQVDFSYRKTRFYFHKWGTIEEAVYCRMYAEEFFGLEILKRNPLALQYLTLSEEKSQQIKNYVYEVIQNKYLEKDGRIDIVPTTTYSKERKEELALRTWFKQEELQ